MKKKLREEWIKNTLSNQKLYDLAVSLANYLVESEETKVKKSILSNQSIDLSELSNSFFSEQGDDISFSDPDYFVLAYSDYTVTQLLSPPKSNPAYIIQTLEENNFKLLKLLDKNELETEAIILLKEKYNLEPLPIIQNLIIDNESFWQLEQPLNNALKEIPFQAEDLLKFYQHALTKSNGASSTLWSTLRHIGEFNEELSSKIYSLFLDSKNEILIGLLKYLITGQSKIDFKKNFRLASDLATNRESKKKTLGISTLGNLDYSSNQKELTKALNLLNKLNNSETETQIITSLIKAITELLPLKSDLGNWLSKHTSNDDLSVLQEISRCLYRNKKLFNEKWFKETLKSLILNPLNQKNKFLDQILDFYSGSDPKFIEAVWTERLSTPNAIKLAKGITKYYSSTWINLKKIQPEFCVYLYTNWLLYDNSNFHYASADLINSYTTFGEKEQFDPIMFDSKILKQIDLMDLKFMLFKLMGFVFESKALCSLAFSLLQIKNKQIEELVENAFVEVIAYDYPYLIDFFLRDKAKKGTESEKRVAKKIIKEINKYLKDLESLPRIKELETPRYRLRPLHLLNRKQQIQFSKDVEKKSVMLQLITKIPTKYSSAFFSNYMGSISERTPMIRHSTSFHISRSEFIDPVGATSQRFIKRIVKRNEI